MIKDGWNPKSLTDPSLIPKGLYTTWSILWTVRMLWQGVNLNFRNCKLSPCIPAYNNPTTSGSQNLMQKLFHKPDNISKTYLML